MPALRRAVLAAGLLAAAFAAFSAIVAGGALHVLDRQVATGAAQLYSPSLLGLFQAYSLLGGLELTTLLALGLFLYLRRRGHRLGSWALLAFPLANLVEVADKLSIPHPGPPLSISHHDGPSLTMLLPGHESGGWTYPSGHMTRAMLVFGLLAFLASRLARREPVRRLALPGAAVLLLLMAFDRLYLEVHWESDVIGGVLLGGTFLAASISWLEWSAARDE